MEDKDLFDWIGFIGGVISIIGWVTDGMIEKIRKIQRNEPKQKASVKRKRGKRKQ